MKIIKNAGVCIIDIDGYSKKKMEIQYIIVQSLNHAIIKAKNSEECKNFNKTIYKYISTGDGFIIIGKDIGLLLTMMKSFIIELNNSPEKVYDKKNNISISDMFPSFHLSFHIGDVFKFTDVNNEENYSGDGINYCQRINSATGSNQVLISATTYNKIKDDNFFKDLNFEELIIKIKHKERMRVYNVYNEANTFGSKK
ncbi:hypothetical protein KA977_12030 [Candidatus Dependentiae bacterium]|nr:hypothetical protein [Candidatus Dependentiae bacterium]